MANIAQRAWLQGSLDEIARNRAMQLWWKLGKALPCKVTAVDGAIVTVSLEMDTSPLTIPQFQVAKLESPWVRSATQVGDLGMTMPSSVYIGGITGLGTGQATFTPAFNVTDMIFVPVSNDNSPPPNVNASTVQGPEGAIIQTTSGTTSKVEVTQSGITLTYGSKTVTLDSSGLTIDGILFDTHVHSGVSSGSNNTGGPV